MVSRRDALPRADVPVRLRDRGLAVHVPRPGQHADLRGPARARDRPSGAVRLGVHERQRGDRRGGDRPARAAVRRARRVLLPELGRPLRTVAGEGEGDDRRDRGARGARPARDRGRGGRHRGARDRLGPHAAGRLQPAAREHRPHLAVPLRVPEPRLRRVSRVLRAVQAELPRHSRSDDREDGQRHRRRAVPARQRAQATRRARGRTRNRGRGQRRRHRGRAAQQRCRASAPGQEWLADWEAVKTPWFYYSNGNGFYHHHRSWIDDPAVPLAHLRNYIEAPRKPARTSAARWPRSAPSATGSAREYRALLD